MENRIPTFDDFINENKMTKSNLDSFEEKIKKAIPRIEMNYHKHAVFISIPGSQNSYTIFINSKGEPTRISGNNPIGEYEYNSLDDLYNDMTTTSSGLGSNKYRKSRPNPKNWTL